MPSRPKIDSLSSAEAIAHDVLKGYADRGLFRGFGVRPTRAGVEFRFLWHAPEATTLLLISPARNQSTRRRLYPGTTLTLRCVLPQVPYPSPMDQEFRNYLVRRQDPRLPGHRQVDPERVRLKAKNRNGHLGIELESLDGDVGYLTRKTVGLVNEIFHSFLAGPYEAYMVKVFGVPEE